MLRRFLHLVGIFVAILLAFLALIIFAQIIAQTKQGHVAENISQTPNEASTTGEAVATPATTTATSTVQNAPLKKATVPVQTQPAAAAQSQNTTSPGPGEARRIANPYSDAPKTPDAIGAATRSALVNIFCESTKGPIGSVSGSGVIIDPRGVILTNAHVAQYLLLATDARFGLSCAIRSGSPAKALWQADILYMPASWVAAHAADIASERATETGEHDYALLRIAKTIDGSPLPASFPYLPYDTREAIAFTNDTVLLAAYPAEFAGVNATELSLFPLTTFSAVGDLRTFTESSVDLLSFKSVIVAQSGSSGGAVVNAWGKLVGIITTTSESSSLEKRQLRALTTGYINRDLQAKTGLTLSQFLMGDIQAKASDFMQHEAPGLAAQIVSFLH